MGVVAITVAINFALTHHQITVRVRGDRRGTHRVTK
jgi:hypothetical protein